MGIIQRLLGTPEKRGVVFADGSTFAEFIHGRYRPLIETPEVASGLLKIAQMIASETIYLMANTEQGDIRVINELSRKIDIEPNKNMTRFTFMTGVVLEELISGNSIVYPHFVRDDTRLLLGSLDPIASKRVRFLEYPKAPNDYAVQIDGIAYEPNEVLHFVYNPDLERRWLGRGLQVQLGELEQILGQAHETTKGFMSTKWKPSIIVKVDANVKAFATKEGRAKILSSYLETDKAGEPWIVPSDQIGIEQIKPLSLQDLAITDTVKLSKQAVASLLGVPSFVLGVGEFKQDEWDYFINNTIRPLAQSIEQELTKKLIVSPKMYLMFNASKLYSYDIQTIANTYGSLYDKGIVTGNEVRDKLGMQPNSELNDLIVLENYIPVSKIGEQGKLKE